jgi:hypothetical protein
MPTNIYVVGRDKAVTVQGNLRSVVNLLNQGEIVEMTEMHGVSVLINPANVTHGTEVHQPAPRLARTPDLASSGRVIGRNRV